MLSINPIKITNQNIVGMPKRVAFTSTPDSFVPSAGANVSDAVKEKLSARQLARLSTKSPEYIQKVEDLAVTKLDGSNILSMVNNSNVQFDSKKMASKVLEMQEFAGDKLDKIELLDNRYDNKSIDIIVNTKDGVKKTAVFDDKLNLSSVQEVSNQIIDGKKIEIKKEKDFKRGVTSEVRSHVYNDNLLPIPLSEVIIAKDYKEISKPSEVIGIMNTVRTYNDGREEVISSATIDKKTGIKNIKKNFESFDGTKTNYEYSDDPKGNRIVDYKITDKKGNVLYKSSEAFEVIDENTFVSSKNNKSYEIKYLDNDNKLSIKDRQTGENTDVDLYMMIFGDKSKLIPALKKVSGDELIKMSQNVNRLFENSDTSASNYKPTEKEVTSCNDNYILVHELGHAKDMKNLDTTSFKTKDATEKLTITSNEKVLNMYLVEKELFNKNMGTNQLENIDYFIGGVGCNPSTSRSMKETVAEINAILNSCNDVEKYSLRSEYMQRYFPKTISALAQML